MARFVLSAVFLLCVNAFAFAQATATINGRIVDQGGAVLPGVTVTVTNMATGAARDTVTNSEGLYTVPALLAATYSVRAELSGFAPQSRNAIELLTGTSLTVDFQMSVAGIQENLTVTGAIPLVETTQSVLSSSIRQTEVAQLPMLNRSLSAMMNLLPGAREVQVTVSAHGQSSNYVSFGGGSGEHYNMLVDGLDNKEDNDGGTLLTYTLEGVQEFKVMTSGSSAEYGRSPVTVLLATKSGSNQYRGSVFGYFRNDNLVAIDYFSKVENGGTGVKPPFDRQQYGGSVGGPVKKDRAWFFGALERVSQNYVVPRPDTIYNELAILERELPGLYIKNSRTVDQPSRDLMTQAKLNLNLGKNHSGWARYSSEYAYVNNDFIGSTGALLTYSDVVNNNHQGMWNAAGGWSWVISPTLVNQFGTQYLGYTHDQHYPACPAPPVQNGVNLGVNACMVSKFVFPSVNSGPTYGGAFPLWTDLDNKLEFRDDLSKQWGRHGLKMGAYYLLQPVFGGIFGCCSLIALFDDPSVIVSDKARYPQGFKTPMPAFITLTTQTIGDYSSAEASVGKGGLTNCQANSVPECAKNTWGDANYNFSGYFQDDFKVSPRVTLNLGLRYDVYNYIGVNQLANNRAYQALKAIGSPYGQLPKVDKNNWQPRVGVAWDLNGNGKDVIRGSYGIYYTQGLQQIYWQRNFLNQSVIKADTTQFRLDFIPGVTPLPATDLAPTALPKGAGTEGRFYDPNLQDQQVQQTHAGWSHQFPNETVLAVDYSHVESRHGWRNMDVNPVMPSLGYTRPLAPALGTVYGDPNLLGAVILAASVNEAQYDEMAVHFERRFHASSSLVINYTLARAWAQGGETDWGYTEPYTQIVSPTGGAYNAPWEFGPTAFDERHRLTVAGVLDMPYGINVAPAFTVGSPRPYTLYRSSQGVIGNQGFYQILCPSGNNLDVGFGAGQVPCGINNARGNTLVNFNARVTKAFALPASKRISVFAEFFNILNRANFGRNYGNIQGSATYQKPVGYLGGIAAVSTIPVSFQVQFGARFEF